MSNSEETQKPTSEWPKAPARIAERQASSRKLRAARKLVAPLLQNNEKNHRQTKA